MRSLVPFLCLLLAAGGVIGTAGVALGQQDAETIHVFQSPT